MSAAPVVPVLAAEIEGERERDCSLGYGGGDVVPVEVFVKLQRPWQPGDRDPRLGQRSGMPLSGGSKS
jgi:hypothetical protein